MEWEGSTNTFRSSLFTTRQRQIDTMDRQGSKKCSVNLGGRIPDGLYPEAVRTVRSVCSFDFGLLYLM